MPGLLEIRGLFKMLCDAESEVAALSSLAVISSVTEHVDGGPNKHVDRYMSTDAGKRTGATAKEHCEHW